MYISCASRKIPRSVLHLFQLCSWCRWDKCTEDVRLGDCPNAWLLLFRKLTKWRLSYITITVALPASTLRYATSSRFTLIFNACGVQRQAKPFTSPLPQKNRAFSLPLLPVRCAYHPWRDSMNSTDVLWMSTLVQTQQLAPRWLCASQRWLCSMYLANVSDQWRLKKRGGRGQFYTLRQAKKKTSLVSIFGSPYYLVHKRKQFSFTIRQLYPIFDVLRFSRPL